jgi:peptidoglycan/LPS O-acetylase OafA/YrhL
MIVKKNIDSLQLLRGIAALAVVCHHTFRAVTVNRPSELLLPDSYISMSAIFVELGAMGVDLFFILSGFLMIYISDPYTEGKKSTVDFLANRLIRVWPLYLAVTLYSCYSIVKNLHYGGSAFDLQPVRLLSFFFVPSFNEHGGLQPILGVGWTLNYEAFFYLIFAVSLAFRSVSLLKLTAGLVLVSYAVGAFFPKNSAAHVFLFNSVILEFILGAGLATGYVRGIIPNLREWVWLALGLTTLAVFARYPAESSFRLVTRGIPAALIFIFILMSDKKISWPRWLLLVGNSSYSIYLIHIPVIYFVTPRILGKMSRLGFQSMAAEVAALIGIASAIFMGIAGHFVLEKPLTRLAKYTYHRMHGRHAMKTDLITR